MLRIPMKVCSFHRSLRQQSGSEPVPLLGVCKTTVLLLLSLFLVDRGRPGDLVPWWSNDFDPSVKFLLDDDGAVAAQ